MKNSFLKLVKKRVKRVGWINDLLYSKIYHFQTDCYVISYPKSGRTWLRTMIGYALASHFDLEMEVYEPAFVVKKYKKDAPYIRFTHDGVGNEMKNGRIFLEDFNRYRKKKVVFLVRDPRDVLVSYYFHRTHRLQETHTLDSFIRDPNWGIERQIDFLNKWYAHRAVPTAFLLVRYEDLAVDAFSELQKLFSFLDLEHIPPHHLSEAVSYASFPNMKARALTSKSERLRPTNPADPNSHKIRQGKVAGFRDHLTPSQLEAINPYLHALPARFGYSQEVAQ